MDKKSVVMRVPNEMVERINVYERTLANNGIHVNKTNAMRIFAGEAITPRDSVSSFLKTLNEASKKRK